jgi:hypothetical protein
MLSTPAHARTPRRKGKKKGFFGSGDCPAGPSPDIRLRARGLVDQPGREAQLPLLLAPMATAVHGRNTPKTAGNCSGLTAPGAYSVQSRLPNAISI